MRPPHPVERIEHRFGDNGGKRADQLIEPEFSHIIGVFNMRAAGDNFEFGELHLRDPDRILIAHAHRHQPRDFAEHDVIDAMAADEPSQPVHIKLGVAGALVLDQPVDAFADDSGGTLGQTVRQEWRLVVIVADEIGEQVTERR